MYKDKQSKQYIKLHSPRARCDAHPGRAWAHTVNQDIKEALDNWRSANKRLLALQLICETIRNLLQNCVSGGQHNLPDNMSKTHRQVAQIHPNVPVLWIHTGEILVSRHLLTDAKRWLARVLIAGPRKGHLPIQPLAAWHWHSMKHFDWDRMSHWRNEGRKEQNEWRNERNTGSTLWKWVDPHCENGSTLWKWIHIVKMDPHIFTHDPAWSHEQKVDPHHFWIHFWVGFGVPVSTLVVPCNDNKRQHDKTIESYI